MANEQNLKPIKKGELSKEEAKKRGRKGGIASGKSRAIAKTFREMINETITDDDLKKMINTMVKQAQKGNTKAFEILRDTRGEKPKEEMNIEGSVPVIIRGENELKE